MADVLHTLATPCAMRNCFGNDGDIFGSVAAANLAAISVRHILATISTAVFYAVYCWAIFTSICVTSRSIRVRYLSAYRAGAISLFVAHSLYLFRLYTKYAYRCGPGECEVTLSPAYLSAIQWQMLGANVLVAASAEIPQYDPGQLKLKPSEPFFHNILGGIIGVVFEAHIIASIFLTGSFIALACTAYAFACYAFAYTGSSFLFWVIVAGFPAVLLDVLTGVGVLGMFGFRERAVEDHWDS